MSKKVVHATLADVAREARVGTSTVSRVINGAERVSPKTLARVRAVIQKLNYHPNLAARILKGAHSRTIGLIVPSVADPFFANCAEAAQEACRAHNFLLTVACSNNDSSIELENLHVLVQRRIDGLLLAPAASQNEDLIQLLQSAAIPAVSIDRPIPNSGVPSVISNNYRGAKEATQHLIGHGCKRILLLGMQADASLYTNKERIRGYRHAMQDAHLVPAIDISMTDCGSAKRILKSFLRGPNPPDAIFAMRNLVTIYSVQALRKLSIQVPADVALLGFDDFELADALDPAISVVRQQVVQMGKMAAEELFNQIMRKRKKQRRGEIRRHSIDVRKLETEMVLRGSCGCR